MQRSAFSLCHIDMCRITSAFRLQDEAVFSFFVFNACHTAYFQLTAHTCLQVLHWHIVYFQLTAHTCLFLSDIVATFSLQHTLVCSCLTQWLVSAYSTHLFVLVWHSGYFQVTVHTHTHKKNVCQLFLSGCQHYNRFSRGWGSSATSGLATWTKLLPTAGPGGPTNDPGNSVGDRLPHDADNGSNGDIAVLTDGRAEDVI